MRKLWQAILVKVTAECLVGSRIPSVKGSEIAFIPLELGKGSFTQLKEELLLLVRGIPFSQSGTVVES